MLDYIEKQWHKLTGGKLAGGFNQTAPAEEKSRPQPPSVPDAEPAPPSGEEAERILRRSSCWDALVRDFASFGHSAPDPASKTRVKVAGARPRYHVYKDVHNDVISFRYGEDTFTLKARPGGVVFTAKVVEWRSRDGMRSRKLPTHISADTDMHDFSVTDGAGRLLAGAERHMKILGVMAAFRAHHGGAGPDAPYGSLDRLAERLALPLPEGIPAPVTRAAPASPMLKVLKPITLRGAQRP